MNRSHTHALRLRARRLARHRRLLLESLELRACPATFVVDSTVDSVDVNLGDGIAEDAAGRTTLRAAIMEANLLAGNDTIQLPAGVYTLTIPNAPPTSGEDGATTGDLDILFASITLQGAGRDTTIIDAAGLGDRVIETHGAGSIGLFNLTIRGGTAVAGTLAGGAILNNGRSTMTGVAIVNNSSQQIGGGIYNSSSGHLTISNSVFTGNTAAQGGGAIVNFSGSVSVFSSTFENNSSLLDGGAVITQFGDFSVQRSIFRGNFVTGAANSSGGAISSRTFGMSIDESTFEGNRAVHAGAILANEPMTLTDSTLVGNDVTMDGGAIYLPNNPINANHQITNNTFSANRAGRLGGALFMPGRTTLLNNTVTRNDAAGVGGIYVGPFGHASTRLQNNIIAQNTGFSFSPDFEGDYNSSGGNLIGNGSGVTGFLASDQFGSTAAPLDPLLGPLANNGGPTQTHLLLIGSPAIDRGVNASAPTTDQRGLSRPFNGTVDVGAFELQANNAPQAVADSFSTNEDTILSVAAPGVLGNDSDPEGSPLTAILVAGPANGILTLNSNGSFTYRPRFDFSGSDSFTYKARDGALDSNAVTVSIIVNPVNDGPRPIPIIRRVTTSEDTAIGGQLTAVDPEGDSFTFSSPPEFAPQHGSVTVNPDGTWTYTPVANYHGPDVFGYRATDSQGASEVGAVEITITPVNDAPLAVDDAYDLDEDNSLAISIAPLNRLRMISDPGDFIGQGLTWDFTPATAAFSARTNFDAGVEVLVDPPGVVERWTLNFAAPFSVPLTPGIYDGATRFPFQADNEPGLDVSGYGRGLNRLRGTFTVHDVAYGGGTAVTRFAATFVQQDHNFDDTLEPPLHGAIVFNSTFGAGGGVLANDTDVEGDLLLSAVLVSGPANGTLTWNKDGTFTYTPNPNFHGADSFTYRTSDGQADSNVATVVLTVRAVNDAPTATDAALETNEDTPLSGQLIASDIDGNSLTYAVVSGPAHGTVVVSAGGAFTYTPTTNYHGPDSFTFKVNDGAVDSNVATVSFTVRPVNDAPTANNGAATTDEDTPVSGQLTATDIDGDALSYSLVAGPADGLVVVNGNGSFTYAPAANYHGPDSFTFKANDGLADSNVATVSLTVRAVNDAPTASNSSVTTDEDTAQSGQLGATDVDGDGLTYSLVLGPANGAVALNTATGAFVYTPAPDFHGADSFQFQVSDGQAPSNIATISITVRPVNDAPVAADASFSLPENSPAGTLVGQVQATDVDVGQSHAFAIVGGNTLGAFAIDAAGRITVANSAALDFEARTQFVLAVRVTDSGSPALSDTAEVIVNLVDVGDSSIDILPGKNVNTINMNSGGKVPVAIISGANFSAPAAIDIASLRFGCNGTEAAPVRSPGPKTEDVNGDGRADLIVYFEIGATGFVPGDLFGVLRGRTRAGAAFEGRDSVDLRFPSQKSAGGPSPAGVDALMRGEGESAPQPASWTALAPARETTASTTKKKESLASAPRPKPVAPPLQRYLRQVGRRRK